MSFNYVAFLALAKNQGEFPKKWNIYYNDESFINSNYLEKPIIVCKTKVNYNISKRNHRNDITFLKHIFNNKCYKDNSNKFIFITMAACCLALNGWNDRRLIM